MTACDIIIPYFQRQGGLLKAAVASIFSQDFDDSRIIIVDDGSPSPVEPELEALSEADRAKIHIIHQPNGGVAAARATGLAAVSPEAVAVLFLDSDDEWQPGHLRRAYEAIKAGADLFWSAVIAGDGFDTDSTPLDCIDKENLSDFPVEGVYEVKSFGHEIVRHWWRHMHLSTTAFSGRVARQLKIPKGLRTTEDLALYLQAARLARRTATSNEVGVVRGTGDNTWHGVVFEEKLFSIEKYNSAMLLRDFRSEPRLTDADREVLDARVNRYRSLFFWSQLTRLKKGHPPLLKLWLQWILKDPGMIGFAFSRLLKRRDPYADASDVPTNG